MSDSHGGHSTGATDEAPTERTPLIQPPLAGAHDAPAARGAVDGNLRANGNDASQPSQADRAEHTTPNQTLGYWRAIVCTIGLGSLIFLQATNISLLTTTSDAITEDLDAFESASWFTSAYLIAMASLSPLNGKLSAVFSPRVCIFVSATILAMGAVVCSAATSFATFIVGRVLCGAGASGIFTVSAIIVLEITGSRHRGLGIGLLNSGYTVGVAVGATLAGALLEPLGWRALFWLQVPVALLGGAVLFLAIPSTFTANGDSRKQVSSAEQATGKWTRLSHLDYIGALTLTLSIVLLLYALSSPRSIPLLPLLLSPIVLIVFLLNETYLARDPIIPIALLRSRGMLLTCLGTTGDMMARWSVLFYTPTFALAVRAFSPAAAGSILIPTNAGFALGGLAVGIFHIRRKGSFYIPTLVVYVMFPITLLALALLAKQSTPIWAVILIVFANGLATGASLNYNLAHLLHLIPPETAYTATALLATFRGFAGSFGAAIGGGLFLRTLDTSLRTNFAEYGLERDVLIRRLLGLPRLVRELTGVEREVAVRGYEDGLRALWLAGTALAAFMVLVQAGTGWVGAEESKKEIAADEDADGREDRQRGRGGLSSRERSAV